MISAPLPTQCHTLSWKTSYPCEYTLVDLMGSAACEDPFSFLCDYFFTRLVHNSFYSATENCYFFGTGITWWKWIQNYKDTLKLNIQMSSFIRESSWVKGRKQAKAVKSLWRSELMTLVYLVKNNCSQPGDAWAYSGTNHWCPGPLGPCSTMFWGLWYQKSIPSQVLF